MSRRLCWALSALALLSLPACASDFEPASQVSRPRLVAARVDVLGATDARSAPVPGERIEIAPMVVQPLIPGTISAAFVVCAIAPARAGAPSCGGAPLAIVGPTEPGEALGSFTVDVPAGPPTPLVLVGATCTDGGVATIDPSSARASCSNEGGRADGVVLVIPVAPSVELANRHPSIDDQAYLLGDAEWAPPPARIPESACASVAGTLDFPLVSRGPGEDVSLTLRFDAAEDDRERYLASDGSEVREALQYSHFVTAGVLERQFSAIEGLEDGAQPAEIDWTFPALDELPEDGLPVRFWWVVRDLRGGTAIAERVLCAVP